MSAAALSFAVTLRLGGAGFRLDSLRAIELAPRAGAGAAEPSDAAAAALNAAAGAAPRSWHACAGGSVEGGVTVVAAGLVSAAAAKEVAGSLATTLRAAGAPPLAPRGAWRAATAAEAKAAVAHALLASLARDAESNEAPGAAACDEIAAAAAAWQPVIGDLLLAGGLNTLLGTGTGARVPAARLGIELSAGALLATAAMQLLVRPALLRLRPLLPALGVGDVAAGARVGVNPPVRCVLFLGAGAPCEALCSGFYAAFPGAADAEAEAAAAWRAAHGGAPLPRGLAYAEVRRLPPPGAAPRCTAGTGFNAATDDDDCTAIFGDYDLNADADAHGGDGDGAAGGPRMMRNLELIPLAFAHRVGAGEAPDSALRGGSGAEVVAALCAALERRRVLGLTVAAQRATEEACTAADSDADEGPAPQGFEDSDRGCGSYDPYDPAPRTASPPARAGAARPSAPCAPRAMFRSAAHFEEEEAALAASRAAARAAADAREAAEAASGAPEAAPEVAAVEPWVPPPPVIAAPPMPVPPRAAKAPPPPRPVPMPMPGAAPAFGLPRPQAGPAFGAAAKAPLKPVFGKRAAPTTAGVKAGAAAPKAPPKARKPAAPKAAPSAAAAAAPAAGGDGGDAAAAAAPRKRKAPEEIDGAANDAEVVRRHAAGELAKLSVPQIKAFLKARKAPGGLGGAKPALLERLAAYLGGGAAPPAPQPSAVPAPAPMDDAPSPAA